MIHGPEVCQRKRWRMMQSVLLHRIWLGALACCFSVLALAAPPSAQLEMAVLRDGSATDSIVSVASLPAESFEALPNGPRGGYSSQARWFRLSLSAPAGEWWLSILPAYLDDLRLFVADPANPGSYLERRAGDRLAFSAREEAYRGFVFKFRKTQAEPMVLYLRLQSRSSLHLRVKAESPQEFHAAMVPEYGILMGILGAGLILLLLGVNTCFWMRDSLSLWLVAYLGSLVLMYAINDGFLAQYLLGPYPAITDPLIHVSGLASICIGAAFFRRLFMLQPQQRFFFNVYRFISWIFLPCLALLLAGFVSEVMSTITVMMLCLVPVSTWLSWQLWRRRSAGAAMMLAANLLGALGALLFYLVLAGAVPAKALPAYVFQIGGLGTAFAFFLAVAERFRAAQDMALRAQQQAQAEQQKMHQQTEFFAMLSHELKTPLAMIDGSVQSLELLSEHTPEVVRRYERIRRAVARINDLVHKFLTSSRLDRRNPPLRPRELELDTLVREVTASFSAREGRIALELQAHIAFTGDDDLLKVLISNLIDNALKYSPPDTKVSVSLRQDAGLARLRVQDRGAGVPAALRERLFESYVRGEQVGHVPGAGLGLHLVRKIARLHGGDAQLLDPGTAEMPSGALFEVTLPLAQRQT